MQTTTCTKLVLSILGLLTGCMVTAQIPASAFSFSCVKTDTVIGCGQTCVTLTAPIPNLRALSTNYVVNRISGPQGCFRPYVAPESTSGTSLNLNLDDRYSNTMPLPFDFPFFGNLYSNIVVSGNGYISFDVLMANGFSHYGIMNSGGGLSAIGNTPENLPSTLYDRALIMAPYQDLDITLASSPGRMIKYAIVGNAPHRKWILSYYKIPLFLNSCSGLIENTQQLVLYESTGIVEVFVYSKQTCSVWNQGRSIIGMQDYDKAKGIMAPGRAASDTPWGSINMNEAWRFTPTDGAALFKRVELYKEGGQLVSTGSVLDAGNGNYDAKFNNVCIDTSGTYIIKSVYKSITDPLIEVYGTDTLSIVKRPTNASESIWTGSENSQWENPQNWVCNIVPDSTSNVIINQGNIVVNSNVTINSLRVQPTVNIIVNPGYNITVLSTPH